MNAKQPLIDADWRLTSPRDRAFDDSIVSLVERGERVLDIGCGQGELLQRLRMEKEIREQGLEVNGEAVAECIARGLTVSQCDLEEGLSFFRDSSFDLAVINQILPLVRDPVEVIKTTLRVARRVVVTFPNFSHWRVRFQVLLLGRLPLTESLPYQWHETPHIRYFTVSDFRATCRKMGWQVMSEKHQCDGSGGYSKIGVLPNLRASLSLFLLRPSQ